MYNSLTITTCVPSKLETAFVVWNPHEPTYALTLEKANKAFLRYIYRKVLVYM